MDELSLIVSPYEGDSAKLHEFLKSRNINFIVEIIEDEVFLMELSKFHFKTRHDFDLANDYLENI